MLSLTRLHFGKTPCRWTAPLVVPKILGLQLTPLLRVNRCLEVTTMATPNEKPLLNTGFPKLLLSDTLQSLAVVFLQATVMVQAYERTGSVFGASVTVAVMALGAFIGGAIGARHIQSFDIPSLLHGIGWIRACLTVAFGVCLLKPTPLLNVVALGLLLVISGIGSWYNAATFALLPLLVPRQLYVRANAVLSVVHQMVLVAGWAFGGLMATVLSLGSALVATTALFIGAGLSIRGVRTDVDAGAPVTGKSAAPAWNTLLGAGIVRSLTVMDVVEGLANTIWASAFMLAFTREVLNVTADWWGFINASYWFGGIIGSTVAVVVSKHVERRAGLVLAMSAAWMALLTLGFAVNTDPVIALVLCAAMGPVYQVREICQATILQDVVPAGQRASVVAARNAILGPWRSVTNVLMGGLAALVGVRNAYIVGALLYGVTFLVVVLQRELRGYQYQVESEGVAT